ncbi:MAG: beta-galactosidase [Candidatus Acidiferrales bacterium]
MHQNREDVYVRFRSITRRFAMLMVAASLAAFPVLLAAHSAPQNDPAALAPPHNALLLGAAWYPEQWPESRWEEDLRLMEAAHITFTRVAEFAWSRMEPSEGKYDFDWLERAIEAAAKHHIAVVLGTPTATPPAWLTQKYSDVLRVESNGIRETHGNRAQASVTSPRYREFCRQIATQMALRFGHNPNVLGWQIDNEYGYALMSYDDVTRKLFDEWLEAKYKTLDGLNEHWTTAYWSQTYDNWWEIPIPVGPHNPGLMLDWKRFVTHEWASYQQNQLDAIRQHSDPRQLITANFMGFFDGYDYHAIAQPLTFASWDDYVGTGHVDPAWNGMANDLTRGFLQRNFWVMETQPGAVNWQKVNNFLNRGEVRAMAWQAVGHGADAVEYWQWRSALNGQEQYHGTLLGADGTPVPLYAEVSQIGEEFAKVQSAFRDTAPASQVALLQTYDSRWAIEFQKHTDKYDQLGVLKSYYKNLYALAQSVDVISPYAKLDGYRLVVAPDLNVLPEDMAQHLLEYVRRGGHLVLGPRAGMKDQFNALLPQRQPGYLVDALGGRVEQYYALEKDVPVSGTWGSGEASVWAEQLKASAADTEVLLRYGASNGWLDGQPAVLTRTYGKGNITYVGAVLDDKLMAAAAQWMVQKSGVTAAFGALPEGVDVSARGNAKNTIFVLINFGQAAQHVVVPHPMKVLLGGGDGSTVDLVAYGVEVLVDTK